VDALSPRHLGRADRGQAVQYLHVVIHWALKQALHWGLVPRDAADAVDPPKVPKKEITPLFPDQAPCC
jgi:integrase